MSALAIIFFLFFFPTQTLLKFFIISSRSGGGGWYISPKTIRTDASVMKTRTLLDGSHKNDFQDTFFRVIVIYSSTKYDGRHVCSVFRTSFENSLC